ncbi:MAG: DUF305 domain-containing protein [Minisyncoccia bacterium]
MNDSGWKKLLIMAIASFVAMYILMYSMVDVFDNVYTNLNQLYMVLLMTSAMLLIEIAVMWSMYNIKIKIITIILCVIIFILSLIFIREQKTISDTEFLRSMIPHHSSALLMCNNTNITDIEIKELCSEINSGQQSQIDWMKNKLKLIENN